jgi:polysaccharide export outer membrane protein
MGLAAKIALLFRFSFARLLALLVSGCIGLVPSPFRPSPGPQKAPAMEDLAQAFDIVCRNYRLGPDDQLSALYQAEWNIPTGTFKLDTLDKIAVKFLIDPNLNEDVIIRPDGMITLQAIGEVRAAGLTPSELAQRIEQKYLDANILSEEVLKTTPPGQKIVTVHVLDFYQKLARLVQSFTTLTGGQQNLITVKPDGTIDMPLLKERVLAAGHTVTEVENTVNWLYRLNVLKHVTISMALVQAKSRKVYVLGQVGNPGAYDIRQPITALQAIALAGGHLPDTADLTSVILISKNVYGKPIGRRLDLKRLMDVGDMSSAILVKPYDVIYVPKTYIRDLRIFMEQYFTTVNEITAFVGTLTTVSRNAGNR